LNFDISYKIVKENNSNTLGEQIYKSIEQEQYLLKISKLIDWVENDKPYTYSKFLQH